VPASRMGEFENQPIVGEWLGRRDSCRVATNLFVARMPEDLRPRPSEAEGRVMAGCLGRTSQLAGDGGVSSRREREWTHDPERSEPLALLRSWLRGVSAGPCLYNSRLSAV
jgi:hypothetical protein